MKIASIAWGCACVSLFATTTVAQNIVGTAVIDGKRVELLSDHSWRYVDPEALSSACTGLSPRVEFCGSKPDWRPIPTTGAFVQTYVHGSNIFAGLIVEDIGRAQNLSFETLRTLSISSAAAQSGVSEKAIPVYDVFETEIDGNPGETIIYGAVLKGMKFVFSNSYVITDDLTVQAYVWAVGSEYSDEQRKWGEDFIDNIRLHVEKVAH